MYAVIKTGGKQYRVISGERLKVEKLELKRECAIISLFISSLIDDKAAFKSIFKLAVLKYSLLFKVYYRDAKQHPIK